MALGWRFYARRPSGLWLSTDVQMDAEITDELSGPGMVTGKILAADDVNLAEDGLPMWLERGTRLYAEEDDQLMWSGICETSTSTPEGRELEFTGLPGALHWLPFDGEYTSWHPDPFDVVQAMLDSVQAYPDGNLELTLSRVNPAPRGAGDEAPPPRPVKPGRKKGETAEAYDDRLLPWEMAVDDWEAKYGNREKYSVAWWTAPYVGEELDNLAREVPFDYRAAYRWTDRDALTPEHVLEVGGQLGTRRDDIQLVDGVNLAQPIEPATRMDSYANDVIVLGAGEGRAMKRARVTTLEPGRYRSTRYLTAKDATTDARLRSLAQDEHDASVQVVSALDAASVWDVPGFAPVRTLRPGDEVYVRSDYTTPAYGAYRRIVGITRSTGKTAIELRFEGAE